MDTQGTDQVVPFGVDLMVEVVVPDNVQHRLGTKSTTGAPPNQPVETDD
jgi:hypothetical protein